MLIILFSFLSSVEMSGKTSINLSDVQDVEEKEVEQNEMTTSNTRAEKKTEDTKKQSKVIHYTFYSLKDIERQKFDEKTKNFLSSQLFKNIQSSLSSEEKSACNNSSLCIGLYSDGFDPDHI